MAADVLNVEKAMSPTWGLYDEVQCCNREAHTAWLIHEQPHEMAWKWCAASENLSRLLRKYGWLEANVQLVQVTGLHADEFWACYIAARLAP